MAGPRDALSMLQALSRGSAVDAPSTLPRTLFSMLRHGRRLAPADSPLGLPDVEASPVYRDLSTPALAVGDEAADFALPLLDGGGTVRLSSFKGKKAVALVFGSYTWPPFRAQVGTLERMRERYRDRVEFVVVYIKEAHPEDGWVDSTNRRSGIRVVDPTSEEERAAVAQACVVRMEIKMPVAVDGVDNRVGSTYGGWPDRLYLIGRDGRVAFQGGDGPFGFKPSELEAAIERELRTGSEQLP